MKAGTLFSGIGAPEYAARDIDWRWCAEIDPFANAVHKTRFPGVPNLGDVNEIDPDAVEPVDLVVFGSPCQSFSVAGKRLGLDDPRGNLALVALKLIGKLRPDWLVFENVPGLLSSDGGRDFGAFLGAMGECGYGFAYAILDAQYFGVPQRRRRLFVVGHLGDWRPAAAVLFEPESLRGDSPPRREAGQGAAPILEAGARTGKSTDDPRAGIGIGEAGDPMFTLQAGKHHGIAGSFEQNSMAGRGTLGWSDGDQPLRPIKPQSDHRFIAHTLRAEGFDASEDGTGTGRGVPIIAYGIRSDAARSGEALTPSPDAEGRIRLRDPGFNVYEETAPTLDNAPHAVAFHENHQRAETTLSDTAGSLKVGGGKPGQGYPAIAFTERTRVDGLNLEVSGDVVCSIRQNAGRQNGDDLELMHGKSVRRLTPVECERLMGFPDGFTAITWRGKPAVDGPRYRALGNSMAVPVVRWLLGRIAEVDAL